MALACDIVKSLTNPNFDVKNVRNPVIEKFYAHLKAVSLNKQDQEVTTDETLPDNNKVLQKCGSIIEQFNEVTFINPDNIGRYA